MSREARNPYARLLRVDCSSLSNREAKVLLTRYERIVQHHVTAFARALPKARGLDSEDLLAVGRYAVLEASLTHAADRNVSLDTWVYTVVRWRIAHQVEVMDEAHVVVYRDVLAAAGRVAEGREDRRDGGACGDTDLDVLGGEDAMVAQIDARRALAQVGALLAGMPMRMRHILFQRLAAQSSGDVAGALGISHWREQQLMVRIRADLRAGLAAHLAAG